VNRARIQGKILKNIAFRSNEKIIQKKEKNNISSHWFELQFLKNVFIIPIKKKTSASSFELVFEMLLWPK
jgi:hypothetical protein